MTRIVAGTLRGRQISVPPGRDIRPTSDRVREALFATLDTLVELTGCRFLDLFAGSGAIGFEAASRGARSVLLVEAQARSAASIRANISRLGLAGVCRVVQARVGTVLAGVPPDGAPFDVVVADPPYQLDEPTLHATVAALPAHGWLADGAVLVLERATRSPAPVWPTGVNPDRERRYGDTVLWYGRHAGSRV